MLPRIVVATALVLVVSWISVFPALADDFANQAAALEVIKKAAADICYTVPQEGSRSTVQLSGDARAELDAAIKKVIDLGIKGAGQYQSEQYKGVLQEQLATTLKSSMDCRLDVFNTLVNKMLGWRPPASQSTINEIGKFIAEGQQIAEAFEKTNDTPSLIAHYAEWSSKVAQFLAQTLDQAYAAQFSSALSINGVKTGMNLDGTGTWQKLEGQNAALAQIVTELRRS
jgi:hypothetical protein